MTRLPLRAQPRPVRWAAIGAVATGLVGGVVGLVVGLGAHPATAWFAIFELGVPASIVGGLVGLASGAISPRLRRSPGNARTSNSTANRHP